MWFLLCFINERKRKQYNSKHKLHVVDCALFFKLLLVELEAMFSYVSNHGYFSCYIPLS